MNELWRPAVDDKVIPRSSSVAPPPPVAQRPVPTPPLSPATLTHRTVHAEVAQSPPPATSHATTIRPVSALIVQKIGRVINVHGCAAQVELVIGPTPPRAEIGAMAKIRTRTAEVIAIISALSINTSSKGEQVKSQDEFTQRWASPNMDRSKLEATVARWRGHSGRR